MIYDALPDLTWQQVVYTLIITVPAIIAAYAGLTNRKQLKPPNGKTVADMVAEVHNEVAPESERNADKNGEGK